MDGGQKDEIACGGPNPASMRGGALPLVGAFDHRDARAETYGFTGAETHALGTRIHELLELNLIYHEYEQQKAVSIMNLNSKRRAIFNQLTREYGFIYVFHKIHNLHD